jgi:hypothetical protein
LAVATFSPFQAASAAEKVATIIDSIKFCTACHAEGHPTAGMKVKAKESEGHPTWTDEQIAQFRACHPIGHKARKPVKVETPIPETLLAAIEACPSAPESLTFLTNEWGQPFSKKGFNDWFRKQVAAAGLPDTCVPHGLRKAGCRIMAESDCTAHEIMSVSGHSTAPAVFFLRVNEGARRATTASGTTLFAAATLACVRHVETHDEPAALDERVPRDGRFDLLARDDVEGQVELILQLILPLLDKVARCDDEAVLQIAADDQFLDQKARHDGLAGAWIVGEQDRSASCGRRGRDRTDVRAGCAGHDLDRHRTRQAPHLCTPRREGAQTMRRVRRVSPLPNRAFDKSRLRQLGFRRMVQHRLGDFEAHAEALQPCRERSAQIMLPPAARAAPWSPTAARGRAQSRRRAGPTAWHRATTGYGRRLPAR